MLEFKGIAILDKYAQEFKPTDQENNGNDKREADQAVSLTQQTEAPPIQEWE